MISVDLNDVLKEKNITAKALCQMIGLTEANLSILRSNKAKAIRFSTLDAICEALDCTPGEILKHISESRD